MHSSSWPLPRLGALGIPCYVFQWLSFQERRWVVLCFRHGLCGEDSGPSLAPRFAGFTVPAQTNARQSQWETVISCAGGASSAMRAVHVAAGCSMKEGSTISVSFWLRMPLARRCWLLVTERSVLCPLSSVCSCCCSVSSCEELAVILVDGCGCSLALILARLLLRGCCPFVPRGLPPVLCGGGAGPSLTRACSPGHITAYGLETGPWALLPRSYSSHPPPSHGMARLGVRVCLHILKCCLYYFLEILDFIS